MPAATYAVLGYAVMIVGVGVLLWSCLDKGGGLTQIVADLEAKDPKLVAPVGPPGIWPLVSLVFLTSVAPMAMPQLVQKFYAIRDRKAVRIGMIASTGFAIIVKISWGAIGSVFLGPFLRAIFGKRVGKRGASGAAALGLATCLVLFAIHGTSFVPQAGSLGMIVSLLAAPLISFVTREWRFTPVGTGGRAVRRLHARFPPGTVRCVSPRRR